MVRLLSFIFFAFVFSCTIIEDSDITSQKELDNLQFVSIEIKQETSTGSNTVVARVTTDSVVNILLTTPSFTGTLTRTLWMDWPALGSKKLKLKGGFTGAFKSYTSFLESGKPWTFYLFDADTTILEIWRFRYRNDGRLNNIIYEQANFVRISNDLMVYGNPNNIEEVTSIIRTVPNVSSTTFTNISYSTGSSNRLTQFTFQGTKYVRDCNDPSCGGTWGGNYNAFSGTTGFPTGVMNLTSFQGENLSIEDLNSIDQRSFCNGGACGNWIDTFYFHPLMVLKDEFELGDDLLFIYMVDWWQPVTTQEITNDEKVTFTFKYDL